LLNRFVTGGQLGTDEPGGYQVGHFEPNPPDGPARDARMSFDERLAVSARVRAGRTIAQQYLFNQRFPGAARIRNV
jgi:hypothetical protein